MRGLILFFLFVLFAGASELQTIRSYIQKLDEAILVERSRQSTPPAPKKSVQKPKPTPKKKSRTRSTSKRRVGCAPSFSVTGVVITPTRKIAIVDSHYFVPEGGRMDGCTLLSATPFEALFRCCGRVYRLYVGERRDDRDP